MGSEYYCKLCGHEWVHFPKHYRFGPCQWGETRYTCFACLTSLSVATSVDANSWSIWYRKHKEEVEQDTFTSGLARTVEERLTHKRGLAPVILDFAPIDCPECGGEMSTAPFCNHGVTCPECGEYGGESVPVYHISDWYVVADEDESDEMDGSELE